MRRRIYEILTNPGPRDTLGRLISFGLLLLIAANVTTSVLATDPDVARAGREFFPRFEKVSVAIFTAEYLLRLWSCTADPRFADGLRGRLRMATSPMALVDIAAILPFYIDLLFPGTMDLRFLRVLRLLRLFRLLRARRLSEASATLVRVIYAKRMELAVTLSVVMVAVLLSAAAIFLAEHGQPDTQFTSIPRAMWWSIVTVTTIGYGDMVPYTAAGRVIAGFVAFIGICAVALPVGIFSSGFVEEINRRKDDAADKEATCPHCGRPNEQA